MLTYLQHGENGENMNKYAQYMRSPRKLWKRYIITISGGIGTAYHITAPNKTMARVIAKGELNPWIKIVKIEEE